VEQDKTTIYMYSTEVNFNKVKLPRILLVDENTLSQHVLEERERWKLEVGTTYVLRTGGNVMHAFGEGHNTVLGQ